MANLKDIRNRIASVKNTRQITRAMKMVSAAKLRKAQDNITSMRPYAEKLLALIADVASTNRVSHFLLEQKSNPTKVLYVIMTSDRGLCGSFNSGVNRYMENMYKEKKDSYEVFDYLVIGKKTRDYFNSVGIPYVDSITNLSKEISYSKADEVAERLKKSFGDGQYDEIYFVYNYFKSAISQELTVEKLFPIDLDKQSFSEEDSFAQDLIFEPEPEKIIDELIEKHFSVQIYRYMSETVASEHAARMTAMENATTNASEMVSNLTLTYNKLRQAAITTELTEISSGAEALKG